MLNDTNGFSTTFWEDFTIAEMFGGDDAILDTYDRAFKDWRCDYRYMTDLVLVLNHKIWYWFEESRKATNARTAAALDARARLYNTLWERQENWCWANFNEDEQRYLFKMTD